MADELAKRGPVETFQPDIKREVSKNTVYGFINNWVR